MRRLARDLHVDSPASLYNHFENKVQIEVSVARTVVSAVRIPARTEDLDWRKWIVEASAGYRRALIEHPKAIPIVLRASPRIFASRVYAFAHQLMMDAGCGSDEVQDVFLAIESLSAGSAWVMTLAGDTSPVMDLDERDRWFRRSCTTIINAIVSRRPEDLKMPR